MMSLAGTKRSDFLGDWFRNFRLITPNPTKDNYRSLFKKANPNLPDDWPVHHSIPQRYQEEFDRHGINIHDVSMLRGVSGPNHRQITNAWERFHRAHGGTPTVDQIVDFSYQIDVDFGDRMLFPESGR